MYTQTVECANITAARDGQVFCYRLQEWIAASSCTCNAETRREQASQEW